ncbi:MAG: HEPN domain-containing protein [Candidatus Woesearchaeota archaeon]
MMNLEDCFEQGLLKKELPDTEKVKKSVETASRKLGLAKRLFELKIFEETILNAYSAMFHAARALLFRDGIREKSHYALFLYVKEKYSDKLERRFINELNTLRIERHEISYGLEKPEISEAEAGEVIKVAEHFISAVKKIL